MAASSIRPHLVVADAAGHIYDHPDLLLLCRRGQEWGLPRPDELMPLPDESELFRLPGRRAVGFDPQTGQTEIMEELAVAAFVAPAHTLTAHPVYVSDPDAPVLPLFAYGAVGFANDRLYVCAKRVDTDTRQIFRGIARTRLESMARRLAGAYPENRLMQHLMFNCVLRYACPAARNLCLGRYEAPLPVSHACNARCVACISQQETSSKIGATPQNRLRFTPSARELVEVMAHHGRKETRSPVFSFGQGCEGEPLLEARRLVEAVQAFRAGGGVGTINLNSNAS
ncbi:MAG: radical SAM protein, partial [Deltaproteobacteria bacterium]|nr:radical SAM protein [Deltaproteobacteria bacterium]